MAKQVWQFILTKGKNHYFIKIILIFDVYQMQVGIDSFAAFHVDTKKSISSSRTLAKIG